MKTACIQAISYYLPTKVLDNATLAKVFPDWTAEKISNKIGISERHLTIEGECASDLAEQAALMMFHEHGILPLEIDFILLCTQSPDYLLPTTACILQHKLGIPTKAGALDYNLGCSGYVYGLALAKGLVCSGIASKVLLLTAETYSKHIHPLDKGNRTIFGDAATATLVAEDGFAEIGEFCLGTDGSGAENLIIRTGGMRNPEKMNDFSLDEDGNVKSSDHLFMNGTEIFNFTLANVPQLVRDTMEKNKLEQKSVDLFIFHQANRHMLNFLRKKSKIQEEQFYICMESQGNTVSSTIPIALVEAKKENRLFGSILLAGFGVGYSWGGTVLKMREGE